MGRQGSNEAYAKLQAKPVAITRGGRLSGILITGASGLLGGNCLLEARTRGKEVSAVVNRCRIRATGVPVVQLDLRDKDGAARLVGQIRPQWIINCTALTNVDWCETHIDETSEVNIAVAENLAQAAVKFGAKMVHISTDSIFGDSSKDSYKEYDSTSPVNVYARTKLISEQRVLQCSESNLIIRTNFYGWNLQSKLSLAEWILHKLEHGRKLNCFTDSLFTPTLANHLCECIFNMMDAELSGVYHVAGSEAITKYDFALRLASIFGLDPSFIVPQKSSSLTTRVAARPNNLALDVSKVSRALDCRLPDVDIGLKQFKALRESGWPEMLKSMRESS